MQRSAWPWIAIVASLFGCVHLKPCVAQTASPAAGSSASPANSPTAELPPSTVSPIIERFLKQSGQELPPPSRFAAPPMGTSAPPRLSPLPPISSLPAPNRRIGQTRRDGSPTSSARAPAGGTLGGDAASLPPSPLEIFMKLKPAPVESSDFRIPLNLATALQLSDARPLVVAASQASVWAAEADLTRAKVLWLPGINVAADYVHHDGGGPDFNKGVLTALSTNFFYAGGALYGIIPTTDAIFEPMRTREVLNSRNYDVQTAKNDALLQTADAYFLVHRYRGRYAGALYCVERGRALVEQVATMSRDLVLPFEVERARNMLADLEQRATSGRQQWRVRSADLTQILRLDPRALVDPLEHDHLQVTLVDPARSLENLMGVAIDNRPEIASRRALVKAAEVAIRRERGRMLLPTVYLTGYQSPGGMLIQAGIFGLGPNSNLNQWTARSDVSIQLAWQLEGFGIGNLARIKSQRGQQSQAVVDLFHFQDLVAADVTRALARVQSAAAQVFQADRALRTGLITYNGQVEGLKQIKRFGNVLVLINRPQEAIYALQLLYAAFEEYFSTVAEYNRAQFDLYHALGYPAQVISTIRPPGEVLPVNKTRPMFLPTVGNGPPPATQ